MLATGRALESYAQRRAGRDMSALLARTPRTAQRLDAGGPVEVALDQVKPGDRLLVRSGDTVPVDGRLSTARASLDESTLSGEATPVERRAGESLRSGSLNAGAPLEMQATTDAANSTFAGIVKLVSAAQNAKPPASRLADRYALWFVPLTLAVAGMAWLLSGDALRALAVLVVATPCPLLLAVPVAFVSGISNCARRGVLIKGGRALELLPQAKVLFFDKTGTLTGGRAWLVSIKADAGSSQQEVLRLAASLDQMSGHVIAAAVVAAARERGLTLSSPTAVQEQGGAGLTGVLDDKPVTMGTFDFVCTRASSPDWARGFFDAVAESGGAAVFVACGGAVIGALHLADQIRMETPRALRLLRRAGIERIVMLTGDHRQVAETIGSSLGVDEVLAEQSPAGKQASIQAGRALGPTMMVGDGVNDAPALAAADVGVAMGARWAAASSEAADVVLLVDRLDRLAEAFHTAKATRAIAVQSAVAGMGLSLLAMLAAALGFLPPLPGAVLQEAIDVVVILNALRALRITPLRVSRHALSGVQLQALRRDHEVLTPVLDHLTALAERLSTLAPEQLRDAVHELNSLLRQHLLPHERADYRELYPELARLLGGDDPMAAMSRTHQEIFMLGRQLEHMDAQVLDAGAPSPASVHAMQRLIYSMEVILRLHFAQEDEIFQSLGVV